MKLFLRAIVNISRRMLDEIKTTVAYRSGFKPNICILVLLSRLILAAALLYGASSMDPAQSTYLPIIAIICG